MIKIMNNLSIDTSVIYRTVGVLMVVLSGFIVFVLIPIKEKKWKKKLEKKRLGG